MSKAILLDVGAIHQIRLVPTPEGTTGNKYRIFAIYGVMGDGAEISTPEIVAVAGKPLEKHIDALFAEMSQRAHSAHGMESPPAQIVQTNKAKGAKAKRGKAKTKRAKAK